MKIKINNHRII